MELNLYLVLNVGLCEQCTELAVPIKCVEYRDQLSDVRLIIPHPLPRRKSILTLRQQYPDV